MFLISMPVAFAVGDRAPVRINQEPTSLWWRDAQTLVIGDTDARRINARFPTGEDLQMFVCEDEEGSSYTMTAVPCVPGGVLIVPNNGPGTETDPFNRPPDVSVTVDDAIHEGLLIPATLSIPPGRVRLGFVVISDGVHAFVDGNHEELRPLLLRHRDGDGGELPVEDAKLHDDAVERGGWLQSVYRLRDQTIMIITERDRRTTTVLFPSEY